VSLAAEKICELVVKIARFGEIILLFELSLLVQLLFLLFLQIYFLL